MPKVGLEPTRPLGTLDFESSASAGSATSAWKSREGHDEDGTCPRQARPVRDYALSFGQASAGTDLRVVPVAGHQGCCACQIARASRTWSGDAEPVVPSC